MLPSIKRIGTTASATAISFFISANGAMAQLFGPVPDIGGTSNIRTAVVNVIKKILTFMALVAVVIIVIAGIRLVVSQGEEAEKDKAKKAILYTIIGLIVILLAQAIVDFVANQLAP